jgi:hypothetical protein
MTEQEPVQTATAADAEQSNEPDDSEPKPERQADLYAAYEANVSAGKAPYQGVSIFTLGELSWVLRARDWSEYYSLPEDNRRPDLREAHLEYADLRGAKLISADLRGADLMGARLGDAKLFGADLREAFLANANLIGADLRGVDLRGADLANANLSGADLGQANLGGAYLRGADLRGADLSKARMDTQTQLPNAVLDAKVSITGRKCTRVTKKSPAIVHSSSPRRAALKGGLARSGD